jgi:transcriptional regulator of acetoin/glycerol metabolism
MSPHELRTRILDKLYGTLKERESVLVTSPDQSRANEKPLGQVDLAGALALLNEAALALRCFAKLQDLNEQDLNEQSLQESDESTELIARLNSQIQAYEIERTKLHAELEQTKQFARSSWTNYKAAEAELNRLESVILHHLPEPS